MPTATVTVTHVPTADVAAPAKKSRKKLFLVVGVLVLLLGVGGFLAKDLLGGPSAPTPDPTTVAGKVETLSPITLNLADGRYLKLTLALQLSQAAGLEAGTQGEGAAVAPAVDGAQALDAAIDVLGRRTYAQLLAAGGRAAAQKALSVEVRKRYDGKVLRVYFAEFLMQ
jgi:flagellar FliL protein